MCLLALFFRVVEDAPLIVGANREEAYARRGEPPQLLDGPVRAIGGRDPVAGGTWLGVNQFGVLIAVTNRPKLNPPAQPRSRGLLVRDLLNCNSAKSACELATNELGTNRYAGCNLVCADAEQLHVLHAGDWLRVRPLPPGLHLLTSHDINDESDRRLGHALWWLHQRPYDKASEVVTALRELCAQPGGNGDPPIVIRQELGGTVSSSILALKQPLQKSNYRHAQGSPDKTPYEDVSSLFRELS